MTQVSAGARATCARAVLLAGAARSGTTLTGRLLHSGRGVEYLFEPPTLFALFAKIDDVDPDTWRLFYETYLYEDFLVNALAGRSINTNPHDDSSAWHVKSDEEVEARLGRSWGRASLEDHLAAATLAYKLPDVLPFLSRVQALLGQGPRVLLTVREPVGVITSLLAKGWFSDRALSETNLVWLRRTAEAGGPVPFWLPPEEEDTWGRLDEVGRCALYYAIQYESASSLEGLTAVSYDALTADPIPTATRLFETLGVEFGARTEALLDSVRAGREVLPLDQFEGIPADLRERVAGAYDAASSWVDVS